MDNEYKHQWRYCDDTRPIGVCYDCRMSYDSFADMPIPNDLWEMINPTYHDGCGILCPTCIVNRLNYLNLWYDFIKKLL